MVCGLHIKCHGLPCTLNMWRLPAHPPWSSSPNVQEEEKQHQQVTNMKFIGELYKLRMMKETVVHNVITKLLITQSELALECLCCLMSTIGSTLDCDEVFHSEVIFLIQISLYTLTPKHSNCPHCFPFQQQLIDGCIREMEEVITTRNISFKVSCLMQDIVALRKVLPQIYQPQLLPPSEPLPIENA